MTQPAPSDSDAQNAVPEDTDGPWVFAPAPTAREASQDLTRFLRHRLNTRKVRVLEALKFAPHSWIFSAKLNGEKVVIKRFFTEDHARTVRNLKGELDRLEHLFGDSDCQANKCLATWPEDGIAVLSFAPGTRLDLKIARSKGQSRAKLLAHSGRWLATYTATRRRDATFGPGYWIKQLRARDHSGISTSDRATLDRMIAALQSQTDRLKGCPVVQAATHGDFVGMNALYHRGTIYGVDIQGECWLAIAREAALFLVWLQMHDPTRPAERRHGIRSEDLSAFLSSNVLPDNEHNTTLPFFVGYHLYRLFTANHHRPDIRANLLAAMESYLSQHMT
ncbi:hypothetical protein [Tateyamaria sp. ANG-S1]|uniref:hypothetical protein n=1 Tax=Tateyamaria sp. ANG-S1 TaxID=1577905 RepID=UPI00057C460D|nr:hypothetical protein [Tateyamaria sp. ANG-S1]KIC51842.1 hypothetical protein RA29_00605 [Tateyamaria sp. ANG-S1]